MNTTNELNIPDCLKASDMMADYAECLVEKLPAEYRQQALDRVEANHFKEQPAVTENPIAYLKFVVKEIERTIQDEIESAQNYFEDYPGIHYFLKKSKKPVKELGLLTEQLDEFPIDDWKNTVLQRVNESCNAVLQGKRHRFSSLMYLVSTEMDNLEREKLSDQHGKISVA